MSNIEAFFLIALVMASVFLAAVLAKDKGIIPITGMVESGTATTSVILSEETSIKVTGSIDFGSGRVDADASNATLDSDAGTVVGGTWNASLLPKYIQVENDGTVNISVNISAEGNKNAHGFIGGTNPEFQLKGNETEEDACPTLAEEWTDVPNSTETKFNICGSLDFAQISDSFNVSARLVIPNDAASGERNVTLTFSASKV
jgi:hypothetical protein